MHDWRRFNQRIPTLVTPPASEPVTVDEAKAFMQVDGTADDSLISILIATARRSAEEYTKRSFMEQTWRLALDCFPGEPDGLPYQLAPTWTYDARNIELPRGPVSEIVSIKTFSTANVESTVDPASYELVDDRVMLNSGYSWPSDLREAGAVHVEFKAESDPLPEPIKTAILMHATALYENRACADMSAGVKAMLDPYRKVAAFGAW